MPELGKATYVLVLDSAQLKTEFGATEEYVAQQTEALGKQFNMVDGQLTMLGETAGVAGGEVQTSMGEMAGSAETAAATTTAAAEEMGAAVTGAAAKTKLAATESVGMWGSLSNRMKAAGKTGQWAGMIGLGAAYFALKGGYDWLKLSNQGWKLVQNGIQATGGIAGVTGNHISKLADKMTNLTGQTRGTNLQIAAMLLRFTNVRNFGPGLNAVFDRVYEHIYNISQATGRSVNTITMALGKAMQDPARYLMMLSRSGVTFTKQQQATAAALEQTKGVAAAQEYVLHQLDKRYGGLSTGVADTAHKLKNSFNVELLRAKDSIYKATSSIEVGFAPALLSILHLIVPVTQWMGRNVRVVKIVLGVWVAAKLACILWSKATAVWNGYMKTMNFLLGANKVKAGEAAAANTELAGAEGAAAAGAEAEAGALTTAGAALTGFSGLWPLAALAVGFAIGKMLMHITVLRHAMEGLGGLVHGVFQHLGLAQGDPAAWSQKEGDAAAQVSKAMWMKRGMTQAKVEAALKAKFPTLTAHDIQILSEKPHGPDKGGGKSGSKYAKKPPKINQSTGGTANALGMRYTALEDAYVRAQLTKTTTDDVRALDALQRYLEHRLKTDKNLTPDEKLTIDQELLSVHQSLASLQKTKTKKATTTSGTHLISNRLDIALQKAIQTATRTGNYRPEVHALTDERNALQERLKHTKSMKERRLIEDELTRVEKQLTAAKKAELKAGESLTKQQRLMIQAAMDLRGTFFGQYASNLFPKDDTGKPIPRGGTTHVEQHNTYNEIPKDRHHHSRKMRKALAGAVS